MKRCSECGKKKPKGKFFSDATRKDGLSYICKDCKIKRTNKYQKRHPEKVKTYSKNYALKNVLSNRERRKRYYARHKNTRVLHQHLKKLYGITLEEFKALLKKQKGVCAICKEKCTRKSRLSVDHDHKTKRVRGLLCDHCNNGIGRFKDNVKILERAIIYLNL